MFGLSKRRYEGFEERQLGTYYSIHLNLLILGDHMSTPLLVIIIGLVLAVSIVLLVVIPRLDRATRRRYSAQRQAGEGEGASGKMASS